MQSSSATGPQGTCKAQCGPCRTADPVTDLVKIDVSSLSLGKENAPPISDEQLAEAWKQLVDERQRAEAERARVAAAVVDRKQIQTEAAANIEAGQLEKEQSHGEQSRLEEHRHLEEQRRKEQEQEQHRAEKQRAHEAAERAERAEHEAIQNEVDKFLKGNGFTAVNSKKKSFMSHKYALHAAVEKKDAEIVSALLRCKADPSQLNSSKKTPEQLAASSNKKGSHDQVLSVLRAHGK